MYTSSIIKKIGNVKYLFRFCFVTLTKVTCVDNMKVNQQIKLAMCPSQKLAFYRTLYGRSKGQVNLDQSQILNDIPLI